MKVLLLGVNGQLGGELLGRLGSIAQVQAPTRAELDLCSECALLGYIRNARPEVIVNAAAYTAVDLAEEQTELADQVNHLAVASMAAAAGEVGALLVHYSTDYVFDGHKAEPYREKDRTNPQSVYGQSKLDGENAVRAAGCRHLIFRTSWVYALRGHNFIKSMFKLAQEREELRVVNDQFGAPTAASALASGTAQLLPRALAQPELDGLYHMTAGGRTHWHALAQYVLQQAQHNGVTLRCPPENVVAIPSSDYPMAATRPRNSVLSNEKVHTNFALSQQDWRQPVAELVAELSTCRN